MPAGIKEFTMKLNGFSFLAVDSSLEDVAAVLRRNKRVTAYAEKQPVHQAREGTPAAADEKLRHTFLVKMQGSNWTVLLNTIHWITPSDPVEMMDLAAGISKKLKVKTIAAWDDDISGPCASVYEGGEEVQYVDADDKFTQLFADAGISLPECFIAAGQDGPRLLARNPGEVERADYICLSLSKKLEAMRAQVMATAIPATEPGTDPRAEELHKSVIGGDVNRVAELLNDGLSVDTRDRYGSTMLACAAGAGIAEMTKFLLDRGADPNAEEQAGEKPLWRAVRGGNLQVVEMLLEAGADPHATGKYNENAFHYFDLRTPPGVVRLLLEAGVDVNQQHEITGTSPLHRALEYRGWPKHDPRAEVVELLLSAGANPNAADKQGTTPIILAISCDLSTVKALVRYGADLSLKSPSSGKTAAELARLLGDPAVADYLESLEKV